MASGRLADRTALITGGSRGIGAAIAKAFAREGARVAFTYHTRQDAARAVVSAIEAGGGEAIAIQADAADEADARRAVEETVARYGRINILVNNAGAIGKEYSVRDMPVDEWDRLIGTDLRGVFLATKFTLPHMPTDQPGAGPDRDRPDPRGHVAGVDREGGRDPRATTRNGRRDSRARGHAGVRRRQFLYGPVHKPERRRGFYLGLASSRRRKRAQSSHDLRARLITPAIRM
jgi:NAD(P)-dependent dehydrogenase (short-subunit alcohol dehydrogenase family)